MNVDLGLFILRLAIGSVVLAHGLIKIGWPISMMGMRGMAAFRGTAGFFRTLGFWPPVFWAIAAILAEVGGSLLMIFGLGGPIGPGILFGDLVIVTLVAHWPYGFWASPKGVGVEFPIPLTAGALALTLIGHGGWTLDAALGLSYPGWLMPAVLILAIGGAAALLMIRRLRRSPAGQAAAPAVSGTAQEG